MSGAVAMASDWNPAAPRARVADRRPARQVRRMDIRAALEWAFGTELASLDFNEFLRPSVGIEFVLMQRAMLGQEIDRSPGSSAPADEAELIAAVLRAEVDWKHAVWVAELARAGQAPDAMVGLRPRLEPLDWTCNRHGWTARKVDLAEPRVRAECGVTVAEGWPVRYRASRRGGGQMREPVWFVPCRWSPSADRIAGARRAYTLWRDVLRRVRLGLGAVDLRWIEITDGLPPATPWQKVD